MANQSQVKLMPPTFSPWQRAKDCSKQIAVLLSGGVDSSVAAHLLTQQNYEVIGVHLQVWYPPDDWFKETQAFTKENLHSLHDAQSVAERLGIQLIAIDIGERFHRQIVDPFVQGYLKGKTPNPCVVCNDTIKLSVLLEKAKEIGADGYAEDALSAVALAFRLIDAPA